MSNLLILGGLDKDLFLSKQKGYIWDVFDVKEFVKRYRGVRKEKYNKVCIGYDNLKDKSLQFFLYLLICFIKAAQEFYRHMAQEDLEKTIKIYKEIS